MLLDCIRCGLTDARQERGGRWVCAECGRRCSMNPGGDHYDLEERASCLKDWDE